MAAPQKSTNTLSTNGRLIMLRAIRQHAGVGLTFPIRFASAVGGATGHLRRSACIPDTDDPLRPVRGMVSALPDDGLFKHRRIAPDAALADLIEHYWFVRWARGGLPAHTARTLPHPCVHWTFEAHTGAGAITGVQTRLWQRDLGPAGEVLGIKFRPAGFRPWFGCSVHGLRDRVLPAVEVLRVRVAGSLWSVRAPLADPPAPEYVLLP